MSFGDKPAGVYLDIVINKATDMFQSVDPAAAAKIKNDRYVDDIATGGSPNEVEKMEGKCQDNENKFKTDGTIATILSKGSLHLKAVVTSGEQDAEVLNKLGNSVLDIGCNATSDVISIEMESPSMLRDIDKYEKLVSIP